MTRIAATRPRSACRCMSCGTQRGFRGAPRFPEPDRAPGGTTGRAVHENWDDATGPYASTREGTIQRGVNRNTGRLTPVILAGRQNPLRGEAAMVPAERLARDEDSRF